MKPLILVFASLYRPFIGGAELAVENISKHLNDDFDIYIITAKMSSGLKGREKTPEGTVIRLGVGIKFDKFLLPILSFVWVLRYLSSLRFVDESSVSRKVVFWGMMVSYASIGAWFLKWVYPKIPFLLTVQEGDEEWKFKWKNLGMSALWWKLIFKKATHVTAISRYLLDVVREHGYEGQAEVVPNGVDEKLLEINPLPYSKEITIFTASRLVRKNGLDILLEACAKLKNNHSFKIVIAGDGPERKELQMLARYLYLEDRVKFLGSVPYTTIQVLYREVDIFVRPSRTEGLGSAFLEAMAAGVITVGTKVGGTSDFLYEGETGFTVKPNNVDDLAETLRVAMLITPHKREEIIANARKMIKERFLWSGVSGKMKNIFESL